jgi:sugar phosphate permease
MQWLVIAGLGFCIYGPQMLIGLCGAELISPKSVGASQGILGLISYMGAAGAGIPLSYLQVGGCQHVAAGLRVSRDARVVGGGGGARWNPLGQWCLV